MDKLKVTDIGGHPIELDDLEFQQGGYIEAFKGLTKGYSGLHGAGNYAISGLTQVLNLPNIDIAEGYVSLGGEICLFPAQSIASQTETATNKYYIDLSVTYDPLGSEVFENGGTIDTYEKRTAKINFGDITALVGDFIELNEPQLASLVSDSIQPYFGQWTKVNLESSVDIVQNSLADGTGAEGALDDSADSTSFYKYSIIGNVCTVVFRLFDIRTTSYDTQAVASIKLKNLPFTAKDRVQFLYRGDNPSHIDGLSGSHPAFIEDGSNELVFSLKSPHNDSDAFFNRLYNLDSIPEMDVSAKVTTDYESRWRMSGTFTFEIN